MTAGAETFGPCRVPFFKKAADRVDVNRVRCAGALLAVGALLAGFTLSSPATASGFGTTGTSSGALAKATSGVQTASSDWPPSTTNRQARRPAG